VAFGGYEVDDAAFGEQEQPTATREFVRVGVRPHIGLDRHRQGFEAPHVDLHVEVPGVGEYGAVPHHRHVLGRDHVSGTGRGDEYLAERRGLGERQGAESAQHRVERADRVHLADQHVRAKAAGAFGNPAAAGAEARDHHHFAGQQDAGGAEQPVDDGLPRAVPVVKQSLHRRVAGRDHREGERALRGHPAQPQHPGGGAFAAAERHPRRVGHENIHQVTAIVDDQVRAVSADREPDVLVIGGPVDAGPRVHRDPVMF
jgi:hypothetical protein